jgi:hypothetical protein
MMVGEMVADLAVAMVGSLDSCLVAMKVAAMVVSMAESWADLKVGEMVVC